MNYKVYLKDLSMEANDLASKFISKEHIIKERTSVGGFRMPKEKLKKRLDGSKEREMKQKAGQVYTFGGPIANRSSAKETPEHKKTVYMHNQDMDLVYDDNKPLAGNLIDRLEKEVEKLKRESEEYQKSFANKSSYLGKDSVDAVEDKVRNEYLSYNPDRIQVIKHVTTQNKPEYMDLEELRRLKDDHERKMREIERQYVMKKNQESQIERNIGDHSKLMKSSNNHITSDELNRILKHEEDYLNQNQQYLETDANQHDKKLNFKSRAKSARLIKRSGATETPLTNKDQRYVRKYMNYMLKKKVGSEKEENVEEWNTTRIKSQNKNGVVNRKDGLPGHLDREDYSMYYITISSNTPRSLSISRSKSRSKSRNKSFDVAYRDRSEKTKNLIGKKSENLSQSQVNQMNSHLAFIKLIFNILDKEKKGFITKAEIKDINVEEKILNELGFDSIADFLSSLNSFPCAEESTINEQEFIAFFLSRSQLGEEYLVNFRTKHENSNLKEENNFNFNEYDQVEHIPHQEIDTPLDLDDNILPQDKMDFLNLPDTESRLNRLRESLGSNNSLQKYNKKLTKNLKNKIENKGRISISYKDYQSFVKKYQTKQDLKFTIPKPFDFTNKDYETKKLLKIQEILEERKRKEDEFLNYKFKPNQLKREIFISQYANVIEAEREKRRHRTEKLKEKIISGMKPFSFYENDERKFKEKLQKVCEAPQFAPFKANVIPWTSQVNMYDDIIKKMEDQRKLRVEERKIHLYKTAKLPPRMELHEKKKKQQEEEVKLIENQQKSFTRSKSAFKANKIPDYAKAHENFYNNLDKKKSIAKLTKPEPFKFNEPKKKATLRGYLDSENDPQYKNPQFKRNISEIIQKIQQKPKIEPASTKSLNLLMAVRRQELEEKQRKEEERILEDKMRKEKQERLKDRVLGSKHLVDNSKALDENRKKAQEESRRRLVETKQKYEQDLAKTLQRVYNRPLLFETSSKLEKCTMNRNLKEKIDPLLIAEEDVYEEKFEDVDV